MKISPRLDQDVSVSFGRKAGVPTTKYGYVIYDSFVVAPGYFLHQNTFGQHMVSNCLIPNMMLSLYMVVMSAIIL